MRGRAPAPAAAAAPTSAMIIAAMIHGGYTMNKSKSGNDHHEWEMEMGMLNC